MKIQALGTRYFFRNALMSVFVIDPPTRDTYSVLYVQ
jgi:hypothetical protein